MRERAEWKKKEEERREEENRKIAEFSEQQKQRSLAEQTKKKIVQEEKARLWLNHDMVQMATIPQVPFLFRVMVSQSISNSHEKRAYTHIQLHQRVS